MTNPTVTEQHSQHNTSILLNDTQKVLKLRNTFYIATCHLVGYWKA